MDIIEAARLLGAAIQEDERYKKLTSAREVNDQDPGLQEAIGEFNLANMAVENELAKEDGADREKIREYNSKLRRLYAKIMSNDSMIEYNKAKSEFDAVMKCVNGIIELCVGGADPATCEPSEGCSGNCAECRR